MRKITRNTLGDRWRKTMRLAVENAGLRERLNYVGPSGKPPVLGFQATEPLVPTGEPPVPGFSGTINFMDSKVAARMMLPIKDYSRFVKVVDGYVLKCNRKCPRVRFVLQGQEIVTDFFLLPLDDYEAVFDIE
ncbi:hypothetical protein GW17_00039787 [Ensete ventricosum]|nr:hypothetical protein GW17_00039787 [Ensete ventricosum]